MSPLRDALAPFRPYAKLAVLAWCLRRMARSVYEDGLPLIAALLWAILWVGAAYVTVGNGARRW